MKTVQPEEVDWEPAGQAGDQPVPQQEGDLAVTHVGEDPADGRQVNWRKYKIELAASSWPELPGNPHCEAGQLTVWRDTARPLGRKLRLLRVMCQETGVYTLVSGNFKILTQKSNMATNSLLTIKWWLSQDSFHVRKGKILLAAEQG